MLLHPAMHLNQYLPIFRFDRSQRTFVIDPAADFPSQNDYKCVNSLNQNVPEFYEVDTCRGQVVYCLTQMYHCKVYSACACTSYIDERQLMSLAHCLGSHKLIYMCFRQSLPWPSLHNFQTHQCMIVARHTVTYHNQYVMQGDRPIIYIGIK